MLLFEIRENCPEAVFLAAALENGFVVVLDGRISSRKFGGSPMIAEGTQGNERLM